MASGAPQALRRVREGGLESRELAGGGGAGFDGLVDAPGLVGLLLDACEDGGGAAIRGFAPDREELGRGFLERRIALPERLL